jgi:hypothetical protein
MMPGINPNNQKKRHAKTNPINSKPRMRLCIPACFGGSADEAN